MYNKLVRDNIIEIIRANGGDPIYHELNQEEYWEYLLKKDGEELEEVRKLAEDSDKYPIHYYMHACHACETIGFKHPDKEIREWFNGAYLIMVDTLHLKPETEKECDYRLRDGVNTPFTEIDEEY